MKYVMTEAVAPEGMALLDQSEKVYVAHDANHCTRRDFYGLQNQIQIPLKTGGITYHHHCIRISKTNKIPRYLFFCRMGH